MGHTFNIRPTSIHSYITYHQSWNTTYGINMFIFNRLKLITLDHSQVTRLDTVKPILTIKYIIDSYNKFNTQSYKSKPAQQYDTLKYLFYSKIIILINYKYYNKEPATSTIDFLSKIQLLKKLNQTIIISIYTVIFFFQSFVP